MGANAKKSSNRDYYSIVGGDIVRRFKEHQKDKAGNVITEARDIIDKKTQKVVKTVIEMHYDSLDGLLTDAFIKSHDQYGDSIELVMIDDGREMQLSIPFKTSYGRSFLYRMPNIDVSSHIELSPYNFEDKDKPGRTISGITVWQKDRLDLWEKGKVDPFWTKDKPGKLPPMEQVPDGSKMKWDSTKRDNYLYHALKKWCDTQFGVDNTAAVAEAPEMEQPEMSEAVEAVDGVMNAATETAEHQAAAAETPPPTLDDQPGIGEEDDDLPF